VNDNAVSTTTTTLLVTISTAPKLYNDNNSSRRTGRPAARYKDCGDNNNDDDNTSRQTGRSAAPFKDFSDDDDNKIHCDELVSLLLHSKTVVTMTTTMTTYRVRLLDREKTFADLDAEAGIGSFG
jgi:hypothetical protein